MTVMLHDAHEEHDINKCKECGGDPFPGWLIFGCIAYCDECLPKHFDYLREDDYPFEVKA